MATKDLRVRISAEIGDFKRKMAEVQKVTKESADTMGQWSKKHEDSLEVVGDLMTKFGISAAAASALVVTKFASFDKAMSSVQAATHETTENMEALRKKALEAGADTAFSAEEAAQGIEELAKAGVSTADVMDGGLAGALDLAAAGNLEVGESAEIAASAMTQFKLSGDQIPHLADLLAAGAGKAQGSVQDLGQALNQSGLVAASTGLSIEETTGGLAAFASAGLLGSDAGTSFKTMLQRLTPQSKEAQAKFDELGISAYDAQGNFVGLSEFAGQLQTSMKDLTPEARNAAMSVMFGSDAVRASTVLYEQGADGVQKWIDNVNDAGYAAETAAIMQDNLAGDIEKLGGAFDTVFLKSGSTANDILRDLTQGAETLIDAVGKIPAPVLGVGTILAGLAGGSALLAAGVINVVPKIRETRDALRDLAPAGSRADRSMRKVSGGMKSLAKGATVAGSIMTVGVGLAKLAEMSYTGDIIEGTGHVAAGLQEIIDKGPGAESALDNMFKDRNGDNLLGITGEIGAMDAAIEQLFSDDPGDKFDNWGQSVVNSLTGIRGSKQIAEEAFGGIDTELANLLNSGNAEGAAEAFGAVQQKLRDSGVSAEEAAYLFPAYSDALRRAETESEGAVEGMDATEEALEAVGLAADGSVKSLDDFLDKLFETGVVARDEREAYRKYQEAIDEVTDSIASNGKTLDTNTEKGRANQAAFDGLAASGEAYVRSLAASGASEEELQDAMSSTYDSLITAAGQFGITGEKADAMAREVMGIPDDVKVDSWMSEEAKKTAEETKAAVDAVNGKTAHVWITTHKNSIYSESHVSTGRGGGGGQTVGGYTGGRAGQDFGFNLPGLEGGGRVPRTGLGIDQVLGVDRTGRPTAMVNDDEWVINNKSSDKFNGVLSAINADAPNVQGLAGLAGGGRAGREFSGSFSSSSSSTVNNGPTINMPITINGATDENRVAQRVKDEISWKFRQAGMNLGF